MGIGTSSVGASCDMELRKGGATAGDGSGNAGFRFRLARNVGDLNSGDQIGQIAFSNNNDATGGIIQAKADADWASNDYPTRLEFYTTSDGSGDVAERMRIDSSGNVGIGTTSPQRDFVISNGGAGGMEFGAGDTASLISLFNRSNNTYTEFDIEAKEVHFLTGTSPAETMRLDANGNLGINETNPSSAKLVIKTSADGARCADFLHTDSTVTSADEIMRLRFSGDADATGGRFIALEDSNERIGDIGALNSTQVSYTVGSSDRNKKKNFEDWNESVLDELNKANPQMFHFKKQEDSEEKTKGYIAQDLKDAFPEAYPLNAVKEEGEWKDYYYFNPSGMVVYLMKAVQELSAKVTELEKKLGE